MDLYRWLPPEGVKIVLVLSLSFLIGLEREEHKTSVELYSFGGVRTFPLIGLIGYAIALLSGGQLMPVALAVSTVSYASYVIQRWTKQEGELIPQPAHADCPARYALAGLMGIVDVDPFIMGMTQSPSSELSVAAAIVIAASSNNVARGVYAYTLWLGWRCSGLCLWFG